MREIYYYNTAGDVAGVLVQKHLHLLLGLHCFYVL